MEGVGSARAPTRLSHAWKAVELWSTVIERRGVSRFPVEKAREEREEARLLVEAVQIAVEESVDTPMQDDDEMEEGELDEEDLEEGELEEDELPTSPELGRFQSLKSKFGFSQPPEMG